MIDIKVLVYLYICIQVDMAKVSSLHTFMFGFFVCMCIITVIGMRIIAGPIKSRKRPKSIYTIYTHPSMTDRHRSDYTDIPEHSCIKNDPYKDAHNTELRKLKYNIQGANLNPVCYKSKPPSEGELKALQHLSSFFGKPFCTVRPDFLVNPRPVKGKKAKNLELDCYNGELKIALEYQGRMHYEFVKHFHKTIDVFEQTVFRDKYKKEVCRRLGIFLICVPYWIKVNDIPAFIDKQLSDEASRRKASHTVSML